MKQKKSLLALTLVFALIFTSFAGVGNAEAKNSKQIKRYKTSKPVKTKISKNVQDRSGKKEQTHPAPERTGCELFIEQTDSKNSIIEEKILDILKDMNFKTISASKIGRALCRERV